MKALIAFFKSGTFWSIILFTLVVIALSFGVSSVSLNVNSQQLDLLESSVRRSAVQCYAIEGTYPTNLKYLEDNYRLYYDKENYVVHYQSLGGNLLPEISVFYIGED